MWKCDERNCEWQKQSNLIFRHDYVEVLDFSVSILLVNILKSFRQASAPDTKRVKFYSESTRAHYIDVKHKVAVLS